MLKRGPSRLVKMFGCFSSQLSSCIPNGSCTQWKRQNNPSELTAMPCSNQPRITEYRQQNQVCTVYADTHMFTHAHTHARTHARTQILMYSPHSYIIHHHLLLCIHSAEWYRQHVIRTYNVHWGSVNNASRAWWSPAYGRTCHRTCTSSGTVLCRHIITGCG